MTAKRNSVASAIFGFGWEYIRKRNKMHVESGAMEKKTCDICGHAVNTEDVVVHRIIPEEAARQAGIFDFRTATLCPDCSNEVQIWYGKRVYSVSYEDSTKRFMPKSPSDIVKEYEAAYRAFAAYKNRRRVKSQHLNR